MCVAGLLLPNLEYLAPECLQTGSSDSTGDLFSIGVLLYNIYKWNSLSGSGGRWKLLECGFALSSYKQQVMTLQVSTLGLPTSLHVSHVQATHTPHTSYTTHTHTHIIHHTPQAHTLDKVAPHTTHMTTITATYTRILGINNGNID